MPFCRPHIWAYLAQHFASELESTRQSPIVESSSYRVCKQSSHAMAAPEVHHLFHHPIADHSFSADRQTVAVARDNNVELYGRSGNKFTLKDELKGHDKTVTSVDIAPQSGKIVTCSQGTFTQAPPHAPTQSNPRLP